MAIGTKSTGVSVVVTLAATSVNCNGNEAAAAVISSNYYYNDACAKIFIHDAFT